MLYPPRNKDYQVPYAIECEHGSAFATIYNGELESLQCSITGEDYSDLLENDHECRRIKEQLFELMIREELSFHLDD